MKAEAGNRLCDLPSDALARIAEVNGTNRRKLIEMGLEPGSWVKVITRHRNGSIVVSIKGVRLALGADFAAAVTVDSLPSD